MANIRAITRDREKAELLRRLLEDAGHSLLADGTTEGLQADLLKKPIDAILIDLDRAPSTGRDLGLHLRTKKATRHLLLIFFDGEHEKVVGIRKLLPDAIFTRLGNLIDDLQTGLANPPVDPVIPDSGFAGYAGRPLSSKLGIKENMRLTLLSPPDSVLKTLGSLPNGVEVQDNLETSPGMTLWFTHSEDDLDKQLSAVLRGVGVGKLWILWPKKASGIKSTLSQQVVRQKGLDAGWVDFKICSFDKTWSGLCFTQRKTD